MVCQIFFRGLCSLAFIFFLFVCVLFFYFGVCFLLKRIHINYFTDLSGVNKNKQEISKANTFQPNITRYNFVNLRVKMFKIQKFFHEFRLLISPVKAQVDLHLLLRVNWASEDATDWSTISEYLIVTVKRKVTKLLHGQDFSLADFKIVRISYNRQIFSFRI